MKKLLMCMFILLTASKGWAEDVQVVDLDRIVISASRMAQHDYKVASNVTVIRPGDIKVSTAQTINQILAEQVGVSMYDNSSDKTSTIDIRGFGDTANRNVLVLVDNRKINTIDISGPDLLQVPLEAIERIEIIRGAGSVLYGDNAVGGVVNIITKKGQGPVTAKVGTSYGSYDARGVDLEVSGSKEKLSYYVHSKYFTTGGYRENNDLLTKDFNMRAAYDFLEKIKIDTAVNWHEDNYDLPGGLNDTELKNLGRRASADFEDYARSKDRNFKLSLDIAPWPEDVALGHFVVDLSYRNRDTYAVFSAFDFNTKRDIERLGISGKYVFNQKIFDQDFNLVTGFDLYDTDNKILGSGSNSDDLTISKEEFGTFLFSEAEVFDQVYLNAGTRYQKADYTFDQRNGTPNYETQSVSENVNMLGMRYDYAKNSNLYFNVQQTFRFLATDEWYSTWTGLNTDLDQQRGLQYELGLKHDLNEISALSLTPYWIDIKREIFYDPKAGGGWGENSNYDKTRRVGFELEQKTDLLKLFDIEALSQLEFFTQYTYQDAEFNGGDNDGKRIPMVARHLANAGVNLQLWEKYNVSLTGRYIGARYAINDTANETAAVKPYYVLDMKFSYEWDPLTVYLCLNNLTNEKYFTYVTKSTSSTVKDYFPAPERNYYIGAEIKF